jgi:hypothetical protein
MLGEQISEVEGHIVSQRVLTPDGNGRRMETTVQLMGDLYDVPTTQFFTYRTTVRPDGGLSAEADGVVIVADGSAVATASGIGQPGDDGSVSWRGTIVFQSAPESLARAHGLVAVFEFETGDDGKTSGTLWEWK